VTFYTPILKKVIKLPFFSSLIRAGFPSPAEDHIEQTLDITELIVTNPPATFYLKVTGESMLNAGILDGDILVVDRSKIAKHGDIVVAELNTEFTVKRLYYRDGKVILHAESESHDSIFVKQNDDFSIFGVVSGVVRQL
jgi:DNA polymerase V